MMNFIQTCPSLVFILCIIHLKGKKLSTTTFLCQHATGTKICKFRFFHQNLVFSLELHILKFFRERRYMYIFKRHLCIMYRVHWLPRTAWHAPDPFCILLQRPHFFFDQRLVPFRYCLRGVGWTHSEKTYF